MAAAVIALAPQPTGFTVSDLARKMSEIAGPELEAYNSRRAALCLRSSSTKNIRPFPHLYANDRGAVTHTKLAG